MWLGLVVHGFFALIYGAIDASYADENLVCGSNASAYDSINAPDCDFMKLIAAAFIIYGIVMIVGFVIKLNSIKMVSLICVFLFGFLAIVGLAYIGGYMSDDNTDGHSDAMKSGMNAPGVYMFGTSVSIGVLTVDWADAGVFGCLE